MIQRFVKKLPAILQTDVQKEFYAATFDQLFSSADVEQAQGFIGRRGSEILNPTTDNYLDEPTKLRAAYQLEPIAYAVNAALQDTNQYFYEDVLNYIEYRGGNTLNHDRLFADLYYSFAPPIDYDKFLNYQNYLWLDDGGPIVFIQYTGTTTYDTVVYASTGLAFDALIEDLIIGATTFNTSSSSDITPLSFDLSSGMRVQFEGSTLYDRPYWVEGVGRSIRLVAAETNLLVIPLETDNATTADVTIFGYDGEFSAQAPIPPGALQVPNPDHTIADYITIERSSCDGSAWTRTNRWLHEDAVDSITLLGQLLGGTIRSGFAGIGYLVGQVVRINIGDGADNVPGSGLNDSGSYIINSVDPGGIVTSISVFDRGQGYSFATVDETGSISPSIPMLWDSSIGEFWDLDNTPFVTIEGQDETNYDNVGDNGTFFGGTGYNVSDVLTMSDGTTITVDAEVGNVVTEFTITTRSTTVFATSGTVHTTLTGNADFTLTTDVDNEYGAYAWDNDTTTSGLGAGLIIDSILASAVSRANKGTRPILEFRRDLELYNMGNKYIGEVNVVADTQAFTDIHTAPAGLTVDGITLVDGMRLIFLDPASVPLINEWDDDAPTPNPGSSFWDTGPWELEGATGAVTKFIWQVDLVSNPGVIELVRVDITSDPLLTGATVPTVNEFEVVLATQGQMFQTEMFYQKENINTGEVTWTQAQNKNARNKQPLFTLYDTDGIRLDDTLQYPASDFVGNEVYSYKILTQERLQELGGSVLVNDPVLGFPVETKGLRQLGDILFENDMEAHRTTYTPVGGITVEANGYYFFKIWTVDAECNVLDDGLVPATQLFTHETNWKSANFPEEIRIIDRYLTVTDDEDEFPISGVPVTLIAGPANFVVTQGRRLNTDEFVYIPSTQTVKLLQKPSITQVLPVTPDPTYHFNQITQDLFVFLNDILQNVNTDYTLSADLDGFFNVVTFPAPIASGIVVKGTQQASGAPGAGEVVEIFTYTFDEITDSELGYFEIPNELENNPNNLEILENSWNEFTPHYTSIITEQASYFGTAFGSGNNYRDTLKDGSLGNKILQNQSPILKTMLVSQEDERDMIEALRLSSSEYTRFKNRYIKTALQLINEGFTNFNFGDTIPVAEWVDEIIRRVTRAREYGDAFKDTYMIAWNNVYTEQTITVSGIEPNVTLTNFIDLNDKRNALYVYVGESLLQVDTDYNYVSLNPIQIKLTGTFALPVDVITRLYEDSAPAYIPATPSKLGMYQVCKPMIVTDDTYATPIQVIIGHDGSKTPIYNDERDVLLLELENRIYMGIIDKFRVGYVPPLTEDTFKPGKFRTTRWTLEEWNDLLKASFFKWASQNKADYIANLYYDAADSFSWNYSNTVDVDGEQLPGYWRAIFDHYYDTQTPHITPWEMLGLKEMPTWWESRYGATGMYLPSNPVWDDLQAGILRGAIGTTPEILDLYVRPNLKTKYLPVTAAGALQATPLLTIDVTASLTNPSIDEAQADYTWGDNSPVEYAWRTSESYPFALMEALYLARPSEFGEQLWNPEHNFRIPIELLQIVNDDNDLRKRTGNSSLVVHGEVVNSIPQIQTGYQVWISNRIRSLKKDITVDFGDLVRSLDVKLGHKMAAFTDQDTLKVFVEGISVSSLATNLLIPSENIDVTLYTGSPVETYMYSGVLIKAILEDDVQMYQVFGYDLLSGEFEYYPRLSGAGDSDITVGGQPASFTAFETGKNYSTGQIVRLNGIFYSALENHQAISFDNNKWLKLSSLPIRGGVSVTYRKKNAEEKSAISYGTKFSTIQQVFDFLVGYGVAQQEDGWGFDTVNTTNNTIADWYHVAKDYLFWVASSWEQGTILMLSPSAELITLNANEGYPANVEKIINGVFTILDKNGIVIDPINTVVRRDERQLIVTPSIEQTGIYAMRAITRETESIVTFDNVTAFNDTIYDPLLGSRLGRVDFNGRRTLEWTGKLEAAGFIITADGLLPNYENLVNSIRNYHNTEELLDNPTIEAVAQHLIGFEEREYFTSLGILDDAAYQFYQGMVREKGTSRAVEKMERNKLVTDTDSELTIIEEWALRLNEYAGVCANQFTEFLIAASEVKVDPQLVQLSYPASQQDAAPRYVIDGLVTLTGSAPVTYPISDDSPTTFTINGTTTGDLAGLANFVTLLSTLNADPAFIAHGMTAGVLVDGRLTITTSLDTMLDRDITITASTASVPTELFIVNGVTTNPRQINTDNDTIEIAGHGYRSGEPKIYNAGGGTAIGGLADNTVYYIVVLDDDMFQLSLTKTDALAATPLVIVLTNIGTGDQHSLDQWSTGTVDEIVLLSATNVWIAVPQIFIVNHPDDVTGSGALAVAVLDTNGFLIRIDMIAGGTGYTEVPRVNIGAGALADDSDRAIASLEFDIVTDTAGDDVILIDVDDETRWITKPDGAACNIADELWPDTTIIEYELPNSGYVHLDDIDFQAFGEDDIDALGLLPASPDSHGDLIHVARDAREGFAVFYLDNYHASTIDDQTQVLFDGTSEGQGTFFGGTGYVVGEDVTLSDGTVINVDTEASGVVTGFTILTNTRTAFFPARGGHVLTTASSTSTGNDDFTLTIGILNESEGSSLATGIGATLTQTPLIANDGQVTMTSAPREDVLEATVTIDVDGTGGVTGVTVTDGGLGYVLAGSFTISSLTHGAERNDNETDAIISYSVSSTGQMETPVVSTAGTAYARNVATVAINAIGSGYSINDILTVVGGSGVVATMTVDEVSTIAGNDEEDFANIPTTEGTFDGGTGHAAADVITLTDGSTITVGVATASTIAQQTETDYDNSPATEGTFAGGSGYVVGDIMTMTDGSVVQVTSEAANVIDGFTIVSESSSSILIGDTLTVLILPASGGVNFTITVDTDNVKYPATFGVVTEFTITTGTTTGISEQEATLTQASTAGAGIDFTLNMGVDNQGVFLPTILNEGAYTAILPSATDASTTVSPAGGTLATVDLTFIGLGIPVNTADVNNPEGYLRYLGNEAPGSGTIYASNNTLYDYVHISGLDYTLSKNGTAILDGEFGGASTGFTTLVNLRFRTVAERTVFNADLALIGATQTWTDDNGSGLWEVDTFAAPSTFTALRTQEELIETEKFVNAYVYENDTKDTLAQIPVYDPFKGIIPGNAALNIRYKTYRDPARYTNASIASLINEDLVFDGDQVGEIWWDLSTCAYLYYEQDTDAYRRDNWGTLFNGSSVDIYEWARSTTLPSEWSGDGTVRNTTDYVVLQEWDPILEEVRTFYYFWIKDRTEIPGVKNRTIAGFEIANIITNPSANLYQWFSPVSQTGFMFSGVDSVFTDSDNIFQINYRRQDDERPTHVEWELGRENDPSYVINTKHWDKMVDSICGYTDEVDIGASAFLDIVASFETDATSVITAAPDMIVCNVIATFVTDITGVNAGTNRIGTVAVHGLTTGDPVVYSTRFPGVEDVGLTDGVTYYVNVASTTTFSLHTTPTNAMSDLARAVLNVSGAETHAFASAGHGLTNAAEIIYSVTGGTAIPTLVDEGNYFVEVITPTAVALHPIQTDAATANPGTRIDIAPLGAETHTLTEVVMALHNFNNAIPSASDSTKGYLVVPDPNVSEQNQQGIRIRPLQTMFLDILGARRVFVDKVNDLVEIIILRDENPIWNAALTTNNLWEWVDWYEVNFDATNAVPIRQVEDTSDLQTLPNPFDGDIVKVTGTRWSLYIYDIDTGLYSLIAREASRLNLLASIYVDTPSLATALELRELILALQTEVFVNDRAINNNLLFFALLNFVFSEQDDIDWAFKTTYIFLDQTGQVLTQDRVFQDDPFDSALEYIDEAKPYQTKVRDFRITRATEIDEVFGTSEETNRVFDINMVYDQIRGGDLSVTEMRIAKAEGTQNTTYKGYSLVGPPDIRLGAAGRYVANAVSATADIPLIVSTDIADYDPGQSGPIPSIAELEAVATINAAITEEFFFDYQGSLLQNTSFGGLPTLKSAVLSNPGTGGYVIGDILELDAGGGVPITAAIIRVDTIGGGIATFSIINGGSYQQTPTSDPVLLIGGSGNGDASLTSLIFENGSSVPHDTTPWDQIGFESSVFDPSVTTLDGLGSSPDNVFAAIPSEETFSGNGSQKEFGLTTTVPTFFMFAVVDGVEQTLNVDYFFIGTTLTFVSILESDGSRGFGAPPNGTNNIELYTYIEAGDLINPQVRAGVSEEMVPLDPRENLIVIADTQNITLVAGGTGYALGEVLTLTAGTFTQAMTVEVTSVTAGIIDPGGIVLIDSGEYTVLPGVASAVTSDLAGNDDATITAEDISLSYRIHNDTRQNYDITRNADSMSTTLTASIGLTDTVIPVVDETLLYTTPPTVDAPQVAWIGTERIIFHGINATANEISGCIRGTAGTHAQTHVGNANPLLADKIFGTEGQAVPVSPYVYWVDSATVAYDTGIAGQWRYTGVGNVHFSDATDLDMHTGTSMVIGDSLRVTTGNVINNTYFIKELIIKGEVCIIDVTVPGTGYSVGDVIDLTGLGGAAGATAIVGGIGVNGGISYVTITNRGTAGTLSADTINIAATGNGDAVIDVFYDREGLVLALAGNIIDPNGIVVELGILSWETDRLLPGGLTDATSAAALFLQAQAGNALSLPAP